jgi:hypothetical protein
MGIRGTAQAEGTGARQRPASVRKVFDSVVLSTALLCTGILGGCAGLVNGTKTTTGQAAFQVNPTTVNFGKVGVGKQTTQTIAVSNTGSTAVSITQATISNSQFSLTGATLPMSVATGQSGNFTVAVTPSATGTLSGTLTVQGNGGAAPAVVNLSATAVAAAPQISLSSTSIQFGTVGIGSTGNMNLSISNTGSADLTISLVSLTGAEFSVSGITTPKTIAAGQSAAVGLSFQPKVGGETAATLSITSNDPANPTTRVALVGTGSNATFGQLQANPTSVSFGSVNTGSSGTQQITLSNTGTAAVQISSIVAGGAGFSVNGITTPFTLNAAATATLNVVFAPTAAGNASGSASVTSNATNSSLSISLVGTGAPGTTTLSANPTSLAFGNVNAGVTSSKSVTLTNGGTANVTISQVTVSAKDVTASGVTTPVTLTPGQSQTMTVAFKPTAAETVSGNITVTNTQGTNTVLAVSGTGLQALIGLTPSSANFGSVAVGSTDSQTIQIGNTGNSLLTITQANVTGSGFSATGLTLPLSINPGQASTFNALYQPSAAGSAASGSITIVSNAVTSPSVVALTGTGVAATQILLLSTNSVSFGSVDTGTTSTKTVTITNTGNSNVQISQIAASGAGYTLSGASAPVTLTPSQNLTFSIIFSPAAVGSVSGSVTIASNATGSPSTISLSGSGVVSVPHTVSLSWTASTSAVTGYNVYRSTASGAGYTKLNGNLVPAVSYTDSTVVNGTTYYYVTTAVDASGLESANSNEAVAVIP